CFGSRTSPALPYRLRLGKPRPPTFHRRLFGARRQSLPLDSPLLRLESSAPLLPFRRALPRAERETSQSRRVCPCDSRVVWLFRGALLREYRDHKRASLHSLSI